MKGVLGALSLRDNDPTVHGSFVNQFNKTKHMGWFSVFTAIQGSHPFRVWFKHNAQGSKDQSPKKNLTISTISFYFDLIYCQSIQLLHKNMSVKQLKRLTKHHLHRFTIAGI